MRPFSRIHLISAFVSNTRDILSRFDAASSHWLLALGLVFSAVQTVSPLYPFCPSNSQDLTGETQFHDGPSFSTDAITRMGILPVIPVVHRGASKPVEHYHLWRLPRSLSTAECWHIFKPYWDQELVKPKYVNVAHEALNPTFSWRRCSNFEFRLVCPSTLQLHVSNPSNPSALLFST